MDGNAPNMGKIELRKISDILPQNKVIFKTYLHQNNIKLVQRINLKSKYLINEIMFVMKFSQQRFSSII